MNIPGALRTSRLKERILLVLLACPLASSGQAVLSFRQLPDKVVVTLAKGELRLTPLTETTVRVQYGLAAPDPLPELVFTVAHQPPRFQLTDSKAQLRLSTARLTVLVDKQSGALTYCTAAGKVLLREKPGTRVVEPSTVQGEPCQRVEQRFESPADEYLFGTGQFQDGYLNIRGLPRRLTQVNTQIAIPVIVSSKGYGLLWHNYGLTDFNPADQPVALAAAGARGAAVAVDVTSTEGNRRETRQDNSFGGDFRLDRAGQYAFLLDMGGKMASKWQLTIDGQPVLDFKNRWLPPTTSTLLPLAAGLHHVVITGDKADVPTLHYRRVANETVFRSPVASGLDYVVFAGRPDSVVASYRALTGPAPLLPRWALGYIHCRERFNTQADLLETAREFRKRQLPVDVLVQDWQYWGKYGWNAMQFDEHNYPDPARMVADLHQLNQRLMLSVWSKIDKNSELGKEFTARNYYLPGTEWVDFFNPAAAGFYWQNFNARLVQPYHIDSWWQDATEPENDDLVGHRLNAGTVPGERLRNVYPLFVNKTVYEGLRRDAPDQRAFILTRSAFPGQQRYGTAVWSGDIGNDWETMRRQLTAGLNLSVTGLPWWTFDAGGFFRPGAGQYTDADYHERFLRWFQLATFSPLQRVHGYQTNTEFWRYGPLVEGEARRYLNLRYRLLPYLYTQAADVSRHGGTLLRPLVMDFADDAQALAQQYEYMFGPAFLVAPVLAKGVTQQPVYLPGRRTEWLDFWTGKRYVGGRTVPAAAGVPTIPLFVRAGAIVPLGKPVQYSHEQLNDTLEIRVYPGQNGQFELYEDNGTNYDYERGAYSVIPFEWNEARQTLAIGERRGRYPEMLNDRVFRVVFVREAAGIGPNPGPADQLVRYVGSRLAVTRRP